MNYKFELITRDIDWAKIEQCPDSTIYKTHEWFDYLKRWKNIEPFIVSISAQNKVIGYFVGERLNKIIKIIGSPFEGIGTAHQGLSMFSECSPQQRLDIYSQLATWIFKKGYGQFLQIEDWELTMTDVESSKVYAQGHEGYLINLGLSEDELFHNLHQKSCRYSINKSIKSGITIRETADTSAFVDIYYDQLIEVFAKQGLKPTYDKECVKALVDSLYPDRILLLEAVTAEGEIAATGLFPGDKNIAIFWGGASYQKFQKLCPNEPLIWEAIKIWKSRNTKIFDLCGVRPYKLKFGPEIYIKPRIIFAKYKILISAKIIAKKMYYGIRELGAKFRK